MRHRFNIFEVFSDIKKLFFWHQKVYFIISENVFLYLICEFLISNNNNDFKMRIFDTRKSFSDIKNIKIFFISKNIMFDSKYDIFWYKKFRIPDIKESFSDIKKSLRFYDIKKISVFYIRKFKLISWYHKIYFLISENKREWRILFT